MQQTPWPLFRKRTIPTERPPLVVEIYCQLLWIEGCRVVSAADPLRSLISDLYNGAATFLSSSYNASCNQQPTQAAKKYQVRKLSPSSPILVTLMKEALGSSATSVLTGATRRNVPEESIHQFLCLILGRDSLWLLGLNVIFLSPSRKSPETRSIDVQQSSNH
jgi:hypothetical protein